MPKNNITVTIFAYFGKLAEICANGNFQTIMLQTSKLDLSPVARLPLPPAGTDDFDFHTHDTLAPAGRAVVCMPQAWVMQPEQFVPRPGVLYSAGIHPWWTDRVGDVEQMMAALPTLLGNKQVVALGECGLDMLCGAPIEVQTAVFSRQIALAERFALPVTLHVVRAYDRLLHLHKMLRPTTEWTVHGFRGRPALARQLLATGLSLSFGPRHHAESFAITPPERRRRETDAPDTAEG